MISTEITCKTRNNETFTGYQTQPEGNQPLPGIVIIPAIYGTDDEMKRLADTFAAQGFIVSVPDYFWRQLSGPTADREVGFARMNQYEPVQGMMDIEDVITDLRAHPRCNGKIGMLGFCFGGWIAHLSAARFGINAAAAYHGTRIGAYLDEMPALSCPVSFHFGEDDPVVPMDEVGAIKAAYKHHPNANIVVHKGVGHNFAMPHKAGYDQPVAERSYQAVLKCFQSM